MIRPLTVLMSLVFLVGCSADAGPVVVLPEVTTAENVSTDAAGLQACDLLKRAVEQATLMDSGVVNAIRIAGSRADAPVADAAERLATAHAAAKAASGGVGEPDAVAAVSAAGAEMTRTCTDAGLETAG